MIKTSIGHQFKILIVAMSLAQLVGCLSDEVASIEVPSSEPAASSQGAPVISGSPINAVKVGDSYEFAPNVSDPDGDPVSLTIKSKPGWASFDSKTGRFWGLPLLGSEGEYRNIEIVASDGENETSFMFAVTVTTIGSASVGLSWTAPTQNEDGSALNDLAGFYIYYGEQDDYFPNVVQIDNPSVSTYIVGNLTPKTHYFVATSYNSLGVESRQSNVAMKVAQ